MNNNDNNNDGLNAISLGSVDTGSNNSNTSSIPTITPTIQEPKNEELSVPEPISADTSKVALANDTSTSLEPVAPIPMEEIPKVDGIPTGEVSNSVIEEPKTTADQNLMASIDAINGDIGSMPPIGGDMPPVPPLEPIAPVPKAEVKEEVLEPVDPVEFDVPETINNFNPSINEIGTVPPIPNIPIIETPTGSQVVKKKNNNKILFVLIIVLALAAVAVGVYILLHMTQPKAGVQVKNVKIEINSKVSTDIKDYATFNGIDPSLCSLDTTEIPNELNKINEDYTFKINCNETTYTGKAKVVDTTAPEVKLKELTVPIDGSVKPEDFIQECVDATECSYSFKDEEKLKEQLKEAASYHVEIVVSDTSGNKKEVTATLIVSEKVFKEAELYLTVNASINGQSVIYKLGIENGNFNESALKTYVFKITNDEDYNKLKSDSAGKSEIAYNNVTGSPTFSDVDKSVSISQILDYNDLNKEENTTLPLTIGDLRAYYESKGYSCSLGF